MLVDAKCAFQNGIGTFIELPSGEEVRIDEALEKLGIDVIDLTTASEVAGLKGERDDLLRQISRLKQELRNLEARITAATKAKERHERDNVPQPS